MKPTPDSSAEQKRKYIQAKYVWKGFVDRASNGRSTGGEGRHGDSGSGSHGKHKRRGSLDAGGGVGDLDRWSLQLSECAAAGDLAGAVEALAHGELKYSITFLSFSTIFGFPLLFSRFFFRFPPPFFYNV